MATEDFKRKLSCILSTDVKGYSRLMGEDEAATVKTLTSYRNIMSTLIKQHRGRVVDSPGDNLLALFQWDFPHFLTTPSLPAEPLPYKMTWSLFFALKWSAILPDIG
ncbi:MAG: hypothetical protein MUO68_15075 [Desulfobacteraceae bacterium]|nr:hypothetical protein [Desulfobacteraceae bacterium]